MTPIIKFCPVCGQGMFIKEDVDEQIFECVDDGCGARLRVKRYKNNIEIENIGKIKKDVGI